MTIRPNLDMPGASMAFFATPTAAPLGHEDGHRVTLWPEAPEWHARAACRGSDVDFFPSRAEVPDGVPLTRGTSVTLEAIDACTAICDECPVRSECLEFALTNNERFGVWGGLTFRQRARIRRHRRMGAA